MSEYLSPFVATINKETVVVLDGIVSYLSKWDDLPAATFSVMRSYDGAHYKFVLKPNHNCNNYAVVPNFEELLLLAFFFLSHFA